MRYLPSVDMTHNLWNGVPSEYENLKVRIAEKKWEDKEEDIMKAQYTSGHFMWNRDSMRKAKKHIILACLAYGVILLCRAGYGQADNNEFAPEILRVGYSTKFLNDVGVADAQVALELWTRELSKSAMPMLKMQPKPLIEDNLQSIVNALKNREIDLT